MTTDLHSLADRVEAADGADSDLDVAIFVALGTPLPERFAHLPISLTHDEAQRTFTMSVGDMQVRYDPPAYTASLDAAMTLVAPQDTWMVTSCGPEGVPRACVTRCDEDYATDHVADAATPALALTAAALRARAASIRKEQDDG